MINQNLLKFSLGFFVIAILSIYLFSSKDIVEAKQINLVEEIIKPQSLCQPKEQTIWSCTTTGNKIASVCASKSLTAEKGYLQYRFGTIGKVELQLPKSQTDSQNFFKYSRYTRPLVTMLMLKFTNDGFTYEIHDDDNSEEKPPIRAASIDITNPQGKSSSVTCKQPNSGSLMKLEDIVPRDEDGN